MKYTSICKLSNAMGALTGYMATAAQSTFFPMRPFSLARLALHSGGLFPFKQIE